VLGFSDSFLLNTREHFFRAIGWSPKANGAGTLTGMLIALGAARMPLPNRGRGPNSMAKLLGRGISLQHLRAFLSGHRTFAESEFARA
jgi:hypothetical protein